MMWMRYSLGVCFTLFWALTAFANDPSAIRAKMSLGEYSSAYSDASQLETSEGYALVSEVLLSEIMLGQAKKNKKQAKRARKKAKAALALDPTNQNARLQYAIADGFVTREASDVSAWMKKLPQKTERIIQAYRDDFPDDPRGDALLGAWHLAIARKTGNKNAKKWFDANIDEGRSLFLAAREARPSDIVINLNYAFSLLALKDDDLSSTDEARVILMDIAPLPSKNYLDSTLQAYAREALLRIDDRDKVRDYVGLFLDGKTPE